MPEGNETNGGEFLDIEDLAREFHVKPQRLRDLIYNARRYRKLTVRAVGGRPRLYHAGDVREAVHTTRGVARVVDTYRRRKS